MNDKELIEWLKNNCITSEGLKDGSKLTVTPKSEFKPEDVDFILCADAVPGAFRVQGTIDVECTDCKKMVILSPQSPIGKPCLCWECAMAKCNGEQTIQE